MRRRRFVALAAVAGSAAVAGCGDASDDSETPTTESAEGQQQLGEDGTATPGGDGTATERATAEEPATEEASTEDEPQTPEETGTETETETETATPGADSGAPQRTVEYPEESVAVRDVEYDPNTDEDAGPTVTGVVENVSGETLSYVEIRVTAYGEDGEQLGDALDDTTDLGDGETWAFDCELWDTEAGNVESWTGEVTVSRQYDETRTPGSS